MPRRNDLSREDPQWCARIDGPAAVGGVAGPGRWLVFVYEPTALFSLKMSRATSSVGITLVIPTPYAMKMAFVDAALRIGWQGDIRRMIEAFAHADVRLGTPEGAAVTHTIVKIRQEPKDTKSGPPYIPAVAYREFVHLKGSMQWAFDMARLPEWLVSTVVEVAPAINYVGKRGSFIQYVGTRRQVELDSAFTQPLLAGEIRVTASMHIAMLDDFGPEANWDALDSYSEVPIRRDKHRVFRETLVPLGLVNIGPGFSEYARQLE